MLESDFIIIGAGIAGAAAAYELAASGRVIVLEREGIAGYHTTGRSAAQFTECYGGTTVRQLSKASREFFECPPAGFADRTLLTPRGVLYIAREDQLDSLARTRNEANAIAPYMHDLTADDALEMVPALRPEYVAGALYEPDAMDVNVHGVHQGFLRGARSRGASFVLNADVGALTHASNRWVARTSAGEFSAPVIVNAAGAWCDTIATAAGVRTIGLIPKRRTAFTFNLSAGLNARSWPMLCDMDEMFYCKPEAGSMLASPEDETPMPPCDVQPEDIDIAIAIDRIQKATTLQVPNVASRWAGLRSFAPDNGLVIGYDEDEPSFFWLAGQGGYGIQTAPAAGRAAAELLTDGSLSAGLKATGMTADDLSPARLRRV